MKKYVYLILFLFTCFFLTGKVSAETSYDILFYSGDLTIREDNTATYVEEVTYHFDTDYNGQIITLGTAGKMPEGFTIDGNPRVYTDKESSKVEVNDLEDGYEVKVYMVVLKEIR